jgi:hypothetical protein
LVANISIIREERREGKKMSKTTQQMIQRWQETLDPNSANAHQYHVYEEDGVELHKCDHDCFVFRSDRGEFFTMQEATGEVDPIYPIVATFFKAVNDVKFYIGKFGEGDWAKDVEFYPPHDWRAKGNPYPSPDSRAIAVMVYDGGCWHSVMSVEFGWEIRDGFLKHLGGLGYHFSILNNYSLVLYGDTQELVAVKTIQRYRAAVKAFTAQATSANFDELVEAARAYKDLDQAITGELVETLGN